MTCVRVPSAISLARTSGHRGDVGIGVALHRLVGKHILDSIRLAHALRISDWQCRVSHSYGPRMSHCLWMPRKSQD